MKRLLIAVTGGLLAVAAGLVLYIANIDLDEHRATIARAIEEATGRKWTLGTGLRVEWGLKPMLEVKNLALANAPWGTAPNMLTIESARARIALLPLLERRIEVMELAWRGASLHLETSADGRSNWEFLPSESPQGRPFDDDLLNNLLFNKLSVADSRLSFLSAASGTTHEIGLANVDVTPAAARGYRLAGAVDIRGVRTMVDGNVRLNPDLGLSFDLAVSAEDILSHLSGSLHPPPQGVRAKYRIEAKSGEALAKLAKLEQALPPLMSHGSLSIGGGMTRFDPVSLTVADMTFTGELSVDHSATQRKVVGKLSSPAVDVNTLKAAFNIGSATGSGKPARRRGRLIPDEPLPSIFPMPLDADLTLKAERLRWGDSQIRNLHTHVKVRKSSLHFNPLQGAMLGGTASGRAKLVAKRGGRSLEMQLDLRQFDLAAAQRWAGIGRALDGTADLHAKFRSSGKSTGQLAASLSGKSTLKLAKASVNLRGLDAYVSGVAGLFAEKGDKNGWREVNCGGLELDFERGVADTKLLLDTENAVVTGKGSLDLAREKLNLVLSPEPKSVTLNLAVPLEITGSVLNPTVAPQAGATLRRLGGLVGSILFPPAVLLAFADVGGESDPCMNKPAGQNPARVSGKTPSARNNSARNAKSNPESVRRTFKTVNIAPKEPDGP